MLPFYSVTRPIVVGLVPPGCRQGSALAGHAVARKGQQKGARRCCTVSPPTLASRRQVLSIGTTRTTPRGRRLAPKSQKAKKPKSQNARCGILQRAALPTARPAGHERVASERPCAAAYRVGCTCAPAILCFLIVVVPTVCLPCVYRPSQRRCLSKRVWSADPVDVFPYAGLPFSFSGAVSLCQPLSASPQSRSVRGRGGCDEANEIGFGRHLRRRQAGGLVTAAILHPAAVTVLQGWCRGHGAERPDDVRGGSGRSFRLAGNLQLAACSEGGGMVAGHAPGMCLGVPTVCRPCASAYRRCADRVPTACRPCADRTHALPGLQRQGVPGLYRCCPGHVSTVAANPSADETLLTPPVLGYPFFYMAIWGSVEKWVIGGPVRRRRGSCP